MTGVIANLALNLLIAILLIVTIAYCWILNRRIQVLQDSRSELAQLLKHFDESTQRASESIIALQTASKKIGENIQVRIDKANYLLDDLSFMIEKGNKLVNQMEAGVAVNRARSKVMAEDSPPRAERAETARNEDMEIPRPEKPATNREKTAASLEAVLERVVGRNNKPVEKADNDERAPAAKAQAAQAARSRSRAEQELLDMIKAGIKG